MTGYRHATGLVVGEKGILILGPSGAGKSALAERIIAEARLSGRFARLVGDDRVGLVARGGRLVMTPHPAIAGRIERRGIGLVEAAWLPAAVLRAVVALEPEPERLPAPETGRITLEGVNLPRLVLRADRDLAARAHLVLDWLHS